SVHPADQPPSRLNGSSRFQPVFLVQHPCFAGNAQVDWLAGSIRHNQSVLADRSRRSSRVRVLPVLQTNRECSNPTDSSPASDSSQSVIAAVLCRLTRADLTAGCLDL